MELVTESETADWQRNTDIGVGNTDMNSEDPIDNGDCDGEDNQNVREMGDGTTTSGRQWPTSRGRGRPEDEDAQTRTTVMRMLE